jgi:hypothetical protein
MEAPDPLLEDEPWLRASFSKARGELALNIAKDTITNAFRQHDVKNDKPNRNPQGETRPRVVPEPINDDDDAQPKAQKASTVFHIFSQETIETNNGLIGL